MATLYGPGPVGANARAIVEALRDGMARTARGETVRTNWAGADLDAEGLRRWIWGRIDGLINIKAGLRSDGAPRRDRSRCRCAACLHQHGHDLDRGVDRNVVIRCRDCPSRDHFDYGGRRWDDDWERHAGQLARRVNSPRLLIRVRDVPMEFRARLANRITDDDAI